MRKRFLAITIASLMTFIANAQNNWQLPEQTRIQLEKAKKEKKVKEKKVKVDEDAIYLAGAIPEVDGKVVFQFSDTVPGASAEELYAKTYTWIEKEIAGENNIDSKIALVNEDEHKIIAKFSEWLIFYKAFLAIDRCEFNYALSAECKDEVVNIEVSRIYYHYDTDRPTRVDTTAEEWITDRVALNKNGTKFLRGKKKFRKHTILRMNDLYNSLKLSLK